MRMDYGVATISRLLKITGRFCERTLQKRRYSAKETYDFEEPTNRSHPITKQSEHVSRIQSIASGMSCNLNIHSQSHWSLFNGTWRKRPRERDHRLRFEFEEMILQIQQAVHEQLRCVMYTRAACHV